eukprot:482287-Hanusia_phi.AAC.3
MGQGRAREAGSAHLGELEGFCRRRESRGDLRAPEDRRASAGVYERKSPACGMLGLSFSLALLAEEEGGGGLLVEGSRGEGKPRSAELEMSLSREWEGGGGFLIESRWLLLQSGDLKAGGVAKLLRSDEDAVTQQAKGGSSRRRKQMKPWDWEGTRGKRGRREGPGGLSD